MHRFRYWIIRGIKHSRHFSFIITPSVGVFPSCCGGRCVIECKNPAAMFEFGRFCSQRASDACWYRCKALLGPSNFLPLPFGTSAVSYTYVAALPAAPFTMLGVHSSPLPPGATEKHVVLPAVASFNISSVLPASHGVVDKVRFGSPDGELNPPLPSVAKIVWAPYCQSAPSSSCC